MCANWRIIQYQKPPSCPATAGVVGKSRHKNHIALSDTFSLLYSSAAISGKLSGMRVAIISQLPPPIHGSTVMTRTLTEALDRLGYAWKLVDRRFSKSVADVGRFNLRKVASAAWLPCRLLITMARFRPKVVILFATTSKFSFHVDWALSELLRWFRAQTVLYLHTVGFRDIASRGSISGWQVKRLLGSSSTVVTLGPSLAYDVAQWVHADCISYIPNTASEPMTDVTSHAAEPIALYLSNLIPEKGGDTFVDVALELMPQFPDMNFILAGAPSDNRFTDSLAAKIETTRRAVNQKFVFAGAITDVAQKWKLLGEARVLVFTSRLFEAQPLTILEALAVGTPVVAFDVGGIRDILRDGIDGYLVPAGDRTAFSAAVSRLLIALADPCEELRMRREIRDGYRERFSKDTYAENWSRVL